MCVCVDMHVCVGLLKGPSQVWDVRRCVHTLSSSAAFVLTLCRSDFVFKTFLCRENLIFEFSVIERVKNSYGDHDNHCNLIIIFLSLHCIVD